RALAGRVASTAAPSLASGGCSRGSVSSCGRRTASDGCWPTCCRTRNREEAVVTTVDVSSESAAPAGDGRPVVEVRDLVKKFPIRGNGLGSTTVGYVHAGSGVPVGLQ